MKKILAAAVTGLIFVGGCFGGQAANVDKGPLVILNSEKGRTEIRVDIADTRDERTKGLMFRKSMPHDEGMFFIFEKEEGLNFWMKNTLIPLDMIFFDHDYKVINIAKNVQPCKKEPCELYSSAKAAKFVLEVNGGLTDEIKLKEGDKAELKI